MGARSQSTANPVLTNFAQGLVQDLGATLADFIAPPVVVPATIGHYKKYDDKNQFQAVDTARAVGGAARRVEFAASDPTYNCQAQALEIALDDAERDAAGEQDPLLLEQAKTRTLVTTAALSHEDAVFTAIAAGITATANVGNWSNPDIDPVAQIDSVIQAIAIATGRMPNRAVFGIAAWSAFRNHAKVQKRQPGAALIGLTTGQAAQMFIQPGVDVRVGVLAKDTKKAPASKVASNIVGSEVYVFYNAPAPDLYDPSFAKCFMGGHGGIQAVRMYRAESNRSDILALDWARDIQVINTAACARLTIS
jgi:hypothetical protein